MSNKVSLSQLLVRDPAPTELVSHIRDGHLGEVRKRLNSDDVRRRMALYPGDSIPTNERNLTDVRNRISLIYEYELARLSNDLCAEDGDSEIYWAYVVSNRYPDLEARWRDGRRALRIEMKCLQSVAEEKAANFDALMKDLDPRTDFVAVILWEWKEDASLYGWTAAPWVEDIFLFHARSLAALRDHNWLTRPPNSLGTGYQGFDLRYAVTCRDGVYSEEEGNYGKLMRIWSDEAAPGLKMDSLLLSTESEYFRMTQTVVNVGFDRVASRMLARLTDSISRPVLSKGVQVGVAAGDVAVIAKWKLEDDTSAVAREIAKDGVRVRVELNEKYQCTAYRLKGAAWERMFNAKKPKAVTPALLHLA